MAAGGKAPQDVFAVIRYEVGENSAKETSHAAEKRLRTAFYGVFLYVPIQGIRTGAVVLVHPDEGNHGVSEILHFLFQGLPCGFAFFPVAPGYGLYIERGGVVEVYGQMLLHGLGFDLLKDFGLGLGLVGVLCLLVLCPEVCEDVSVVHDEGCDCRKNQIHSRYRLPCPFPIQVLCLAALRLPQRRFRRCILWHPSRLPLAPSPPPPSPTGRLWHLRGLSARFAWSR